MTTGRPSLALFSMLSLFAVAATAAEPVEARGNVEGPVIYVTSQGLFYDSIVYAAEEASEEAKG